ncbi:hypothetical protein, partial [Clostridium perfringens]|uniref:hypothetical protein n=1 Tax=Clostridium perfringens TaxID=1502 RepID=UPI0039E8BFCC
FNFLNELIFCSKFEFSSSISFDFFSMLEKYIIINIININRSNNIISLNRGLSFALIIELNEIVKSRTIVKIIKYIIELFLDFMVL